MRTSKWLRRAIAPVIALCALAFAGTAMATPPSPPFTQCPAVFADTSCGTLIVVNPDGSLVAYNDPSQGPYEQIDDVLIGVQNNSSSPLSSINLSGSGNGGGIFAFDGDGICAFVLCGFGPQGYEGPGVNYSNINFDGTSGTVDFIGGLQPGASTYFSLEGAITLQCAASLCTPSATDDAITAAGSNLNATEGAAFNGRVAGFTDPDTSALASEYTATIDWGDGTPVTAGTISGSGGNFAVSGNHTYGDEGSYSVTVVITDSTDATNSATAANTMSVADAALTASGVNPGPISPQSFSGTVANFTDANTSSTTADFTATIDWGDGTPATAGTIGGSGGSYSVTGSHQWSDTGYFTVKVHIVDDGGSTADATTQVLVYGTAQGGNFVIGDKNAATGTSVNFWGAQWWKLNTLSNTPSNTLIGGTGPASFKGFENNPAAAACGTNWTSRTGNSTPPPAGPLPKYMLVIVSSKVGQSGSSISGNTVHEVVVKTSPGYASDPGHAGNGVVAASIC